MSGLGEDMHSNALQLLFSLLERHNGGRWENIIADFGNKLITSFASLTIIDTPLHCHPRAYTFRS
jgi:hypothetical protein